jgi:solute carrier family 25 carnitine/acylcarnitine transporter 20/29
MMTNELKLEFDEKRNMSIYGRLAYTVRERGGFLALYRGILPGTLRSFIGNGCAMIVMQYCQKKVTELGLRDED